MILLYLGAGKIREGRSIDNAACTSNSAKEFVSGNHEESDHGRLSNENTENSQDIKHEIIETEEPTEWPSIFGDDTTYEEWHGFLGRHGLLKQERLRVRSPPVNRTNSACQTFHQSK